MDTFSPKKRSEIMAAIRSTRNQETEMALLAILRKNGIVGWRRNAKVSGKPDFIFPRNRVAVFVDGCFWHKCSKHFRLPASNKAYWSGKIARNVRRDREVTQSLKTAGWKVLRLWQHELRDEKKVVRRVRLAVKQLTQQAQ